MDPAIIRYNALCASGNRYIVLADARALGHYRIWDRWAQGPIAGPAYSAAQPAERECAHLNAAARAGAVR